MKYNWQKNLKRLPIQSLAPKISDKMHHKTLKHALPQSLVHIINDDIQRKNATYLPEQSPAHKINDKNTNLKHLHQQSIAHKISMLKCLKKNIKKSQCFSSNLRTKSVIKCTSHKNLWNVLRQLLSCKISHKIQLKNLKYLPPQSLACEVYRKQENEVKDLLPQSRRTRKINDKMH